MKTLLCIAVLILSTTSAAACDVPGHGTQTLLEKLPPTALQNEVVAKVEVVELETPGAVTRSNWWEKTKTRGKVRVLDAIQGVQLGQVFAIEAGGGCDQPLSVGLQGYISGQFVERNAGSYFVGPWHWAP